MLEQNKQRNLLAAAGATVTATSCIFAEGGTDGVIGTDFGTEVKLMRSVTNLCTHEDACGQSNIFVPISTLVITVDYSKVLLVLCDKPYACRDLDRQFALN